jgi:SAM-dependent methyltransferase
MTHDWRSYNSAAETHERIAVPYVFLEPAQHLVEAVRLAPGARVLDAGCGTGVVARLAARAVAPGGIVVALDPAMEMLRVGRAHDIGAPLCGQAQSLPFPDGAFDAALAGFVISHVPSYEAALAEMVRVLAPGATLGVSAWGPAEDQYRQHWRGIAERFGGHAAMQQVVPWEEWLSDPARLRDALRGAGLVSVQTETHDYRNPIPVADFLTARDFSVQARFLRRHLSADDWDRFRATVAEEFRRFGDTIENVRDAHIATGRKVG